MLEEKCQHLDKMLIVVLHVSLFSGRRKLNSDDLEKDVRDALPPETLASLGTKKVFDPEELGKLNSVKREAQEAIAAVSVKTDLGEAVPIVEFKELAAKLNDLETRWNALKNALLANYDNICAAWAKKYPAWQQNIQNGQFTRAYVEDRLRFCWFPVKVQGYSVEGGSSRSLDQVVGGMGSQLFLEIADKAQEIVNKSLLPKGQQRTEANRKICRPFRYIESKLRALAFLDSRAEPVANLVDRVISSLPDEGKFGEKELSALLSLAMILKEPDTAMLYGQRLLTESIDDVAAGFMGSLPLKKPVVPQVVVNNGVAVEDLFVQSEKHTAHDAVVAVGNTGKANDLPVVTPAVIHETVIPQAPARRVYHDAVL